MEQEISQKLEGLHTVETIAEKLNITRDSALNVVSRLKKAGYLAKSGGGKQKRLYKITVTKQRPRNPGMFDIINRYSPMKLNPWYDHQVHGRYGPEEALIDAIETGSFRAILASMRLFNHITDWSKLYAMAKRIGIWQKVGALYDVARRYKRVMAMPKKYNKYSPNQWVQLTILKDRKNFPDIQKKWKVLIPFNEKDIEEIQ